jgi:hypothetical protein
MRTKKDADVAAVKVEGSAKSAPTSKVKKGKEAAIKPNNKQLPAGYHEDGMWTKHVIPTLFRWAAVQRKPFAIPEAKIAEALKVICNTLYSPSIPIEITPSSPEFRIVSCVVALLCTY